MNYKILNMTNGTITWFEIDKGELPPETKNYHDKYLTLLPTGYICEANFAHSDKSWIYSGGWCKPTHWAYINYP